MRLLQAGLAAVLLASATYAASPMVTGWLIKEAVEDGNAAYLERKIAWAEVRASLAPSLQSYVSGQPLQAETASTAKPSLWQRLKARFTKSAVDRVVDGYVTPQGFSQLFNYRQSYRAAVGTAEPPKTLANLPARLSSFASRIRRVAFTALDTFEIEVVDRSEATRLFAGRLQWRDGHWMMTSLEIRTAATDDIPAEAL